MKLFDFFSKKQTSVELDNEQVSTVGVTNFFSLDGIAYNPDNIDLKTYRKMSKQYQVSAALAVISYSIQQIDWFIKADNENVKNVLTVSVDRIWNRLIRSISKSFVYGFSPNVKVFTLERINGREYIIYKKIRDLDPTDCEVVIDKWGNYNGFWYKKGDSIKQKLVAPEYSFWYTSDMENGNLYGESMLKKVYKPWWFNEKMHVFANRYYERFGEPLVIGRSPSGVKVKDSKGTLKDAQDLMRDVIGEIRSHTSVNLPSEKDSENGDYLYDLKYLESMMRGFDFDNYLQRLDMEVTKGLLLPELMFGGIKGGSYSLGSAQIEVFYTNLMGIMDNITDYVNLYILPQLIEYNFDKNKNAKFTYQPLSASSKKFITDLILKLLDKGKIDLDLEQIEERSGFKISKAKESPVKPIVNPNLQPKPQPKLQPTTPKKQK